MTLMTTNVRQMMLSRMVAIIVFTVALGAIAGVANAQQSRGGPLGGAPAEAIEACANKSVGDICSMTAPRDGGTAAGQCISTPDNKVACLPEGAPRPPKS